MTDREPPTRGRGMDRKAGKLQLCGFTTCASLNGGLKAHGHRRRFEQVQRLPSGPRLCLHSPSELETGAMGYVGSSLPRVIDTPIRIGDNGIHQPEPRVCEKSFKVSVPEVVGVLAWLHMLPLKF